VRKRRRRFEKKGVPTGQGGSRKGKALRVLYDDKRTTSPSERRSPRTATAAYFWKGGPKEKRKLRLP